MTRLTAILLGFLCLPVYLLAQNSALEFDGLSERVTMETSPGTTLSQTYTLEAWIFAREWKGQSWMGSIITNDAGTGNGGFAFRCGNGGRLSLAVFANNTWNEALSDAVMNIAKWHHVAAVINEGTSTLYVDGIEVARATFQGQPDASDQLITIGESTGFPGRLFDGVIDEVRIWSTARSPEEIASNRFTSFTGDETGLEAYLPMNASSGTVVENLADDNYPGTTINMDDSNWVQGFSVPEYDVAVSNISNIDRLALKERPIKPSINLQNVGTQTITGVTATLSVDGVILATETVDLSLEPGAGGQYRFATPINLTGLNDPVIAVQVSHPEDTNTLNNQTQTSFSSRNGLTVNIFDGEQHNFAAAGQRQAAKVTLPGDLSEYEEIRLRIDVQCPATGCDPWDQPANIKIVTAQGVYELGRYITPFGIACGPWVIDVTDFKSVLIGEVIFESYVQVWGPSGWLIDMDLEFVESSTKTHSKISTMHALDYQVYGDPGISYDLAEVELTVADNTEESHIRMQVTGHGQGNTNNAAEFFRRNHQLLINGNRLANHDLWKADCNTNSCANQAGTWLFARAGWCPGQEVIPAIFNTSGELSSGETFDFDYELQAYTNLRNTGYNGGSHTEPHYRIHSFFVETSTTPYVSYNNLAVTAIRFSQDEVISDIGNLGTTEVGNYQMRLYADGQLIDTQDITNPLVAGSSSTFRFTTDVDALLNALVIVEVVAIDDQNPGDNLLGVTYTGTLSTGEELAQGAYSLYPNPSSGLVNIQVDDILLGGEWVLYTVDGRVLDRNRINDYSTTINISQKGVFVLQAVSQSGASLSQKVVIY